MPLPALLFTLLLVLWEMLIFRIDYADFLRETITTDYSIWTPRMIARLVGAILGSLTLTLLFVWVSFNVGRGTRIICFVLFTGAVLYEYGYYGALHRFSAPEDVMLLALYTEGALFTGAIMSYINGQALVPIAVYGGLLLTLRSGRRFKPRALVGVLSVTLLFYSLVFRVWSVSESAFPTTAFGAFLRTTTFVPWKVITSYHGPRDRIVYHTHHRPTNNIVFVVDESIRADHLSLNGYGRPTTPYLEELAKQKLIFNWGQATAGATCSLQSNTLLLTGATVLPNTQHRLARLPSIFQYAQAMGYTTYYLDASNATFWNGTGDDLRYIDHWENARQFADGAVYTADAQLAERTRSLLAGSTGNFVWLNKRGVHFLYNHTFPQDQAWWTPVMRGYEHDPAQQAELVNSYDNGVHYNLERFFRTLLADTSLVDHTTILYTSDHGQTLAEHGETWSHCSDTRNEALVPLFMVAKHGDQLDTGYQAGHANIFATLLDLMGFPLLERSYPYAASLLSARAADSSRRQYYFGALDGSGPSGWKPFDP